MKYDPLKAEIIYIDDEDILTLSNLSDEDGNGKVVDWADLEFLKPQ